MILEDYSVPGTVSAGAAGDAGGSTSNMLLPKLGHAVLPAFIAIGALSGGTCVPVRLPPSPISMPLIRVSAAIASESESESDNLADSSSLLPELAKSVRALHERSGLTWDELAYIFGVSRRTLHNWSTGGQVSASHAQAIASVMGVIHEVDAGDPKLTRSKLLAPTAEGETAYTRLATSLKRPKTTAPDYRPDQLLSARHNSPDPTGSLVNFKRQN
jgi:DNA-binding transcriptional regulator YiaG